MINTGFFNRYTCCKNFRFRFILLSPLFVFLFFSLQSQAQFHLDKDSIQQTGQLLNSGWKFIEGDKTQFAQPQYNDQNWQPIDPTTDAYLQKFIQPGKIYWFRLKLAAPVAERDLAMIIQQSGAAEIFIDGKLTHRFGNLGTNAKGIFAWDPLYKPVSLTLPDRDTTVLAIRFALQPGIRYSTIFESRNALFHIQVFNMKAALDYFSFYRSLLVGFLLFIIGVCFIQAILHLAFHIFYPAQQENLSIALYAFGFLIFNLIQFEFFLENHSVSAKFALSNFAMNLRTFCSFFLLSALYRLLGQRKDRIYWVLVVLLICSFFLNLWPYDKGWKMGGALMEVLVGAGITRIAIKAVRKKMKGAWIILAGAIIYFTSFGIFFSYIFRPEFAFLQNLSPVRIGFYVISFMSIPVATSIYLALDFALTNKRLNQKLDEVRELSELNLRSEKEKKEILSSQNEKLELLVKARTNELSESLEKLKSTQAQLIQSEKMASLGELTAGIAHEIQNPLNFVNNFSEINTELIDDLNYEIDLGNTKEAKLIAESLRDNETKIAHHGKRADAIVKGMLQHSRNSAAIIEPTDLNALCQEYLSLSYHGFRTKEKFFSSELSTDLDPNIGNINLVPQDIGKVLLNILNNAFYTMSEKQKEKEEQQKDKKQKTETGNSRDAMHGVSTTTNAYQPHVSVSTKRNGDQVEITVKDNGNGISQNMLGKIFQPFFTTKPTGQGTGLGLSLSYDIIKAHSGGIKVFSTEGEGSEFLITLNANS